MHPVSTASSHFFTLLLISVCLLCLLSPNSFWLLQYFLVYNLSAFFLVFDRHSHLIPERKMCQEKHAVVVACLPECSESPFIVSPAHSAWYQMLALDVGEVDVKPFVMPQRARDPLSDWEVRLVFVSYGTYESPDTNGQNSLCMIKMKPFIHLKRW